MVGTQFIIHISQMLPKKEERMIGDSQWVFSIWFVVALEINTTILRKRT